MLILNLMQTLEHEHISSVNMDTIRALAETLSRHPEEYMPWLVECCKFSELSKTFFFLVLLQSFTMPKIGILTGSSFSFKFFVGVFYAHVYWPPLCDVLVGV